MKQEEVQKTLRLQVEAGEVNPPADREEITPNEGLEVILPADRERFNPQEDLGLGLPLVAVEATEFNFPAERERFNPQENFTMILPLVAVEAMEVKLPTRERFKNIGVILPLVAVEAMEVNFPTNRERIRPEEDLGVVFHVVALKGAAVNHWVATTIRRDILSSSKIASINHLL